MPFQRIKLPIHAMAPRITIITPCFNQVGSLAQTIESVLAQNYSNLEYLVIDMGSTDGTQQVIERYRHRITHYLSEPAFRARADFTGGLSAAIHRGFTLASGDIVAWLGGTDVYVPGALAVVAKAFTQIPAAGLVYGRCQTIDADGRHLGDLPAWKFNYEQLMANCQSPISQSAAFVAREAVVLVGLPRADLSLTMDYDLWLRLGSWLPVVALDQVLARQRVRPPVPLRLTTSMAREARAVYEQVLANPFYPEEIHVLARQAIHRVTAA